MRLNVFIRTDASIQIGTGHVMRCITLAKQLTRHGANVTFICRAFEGALLSFIEQQKMKVLVLPSINKTENDIQWIKRHWLIDAEETIETISHKNKEVDLFIVDHYGLDSRWELELRTYVSHLMVIDDLADRSHDCDLLLDQNYTVEMKSRYEGLVPTNCIQMLGPDYVLLRDEFIQMANKKRLRTGEVRNILIFFGGTDPTGETIKAIQAIRELDFSKIKVIVIVGALNPARYEVETLCETLSVQFYCQVDNMAELMWQADLCIGAGGATAWERCFLALPALTVIIAENQRESTELLHEEGATVCLGDSNQVSSRTIKMQVDALLGHPEKVRSLSEKSSMIVHAGKVKDFVVLQTIQRVLGGTK